MATPLEVIFNVLSTTGDAPGDWFDFNQAGNSYLEILQCVHCLLNTPVGSVVLDRAIGVDYEFVDKPLPIAVAMILAEVPAKIKKYEPRCTVTNCTFSGNVSSIVSEGQLMVNLTVSIP